MLLWELIKFDQRMLTLSDACRWPSLAYGRDGRTPKVLRIQWQSPIAPCWVIKRPRGGKCAFVGTTDSSPVTYLSSFTRCILFTDVALCELIVCPFSFRTLSRSNIKLLSTNPSSDRDFRVCDRQSFFIHPINIIDKCFLSFSSKERSTNVTCNKQWNASNKIDSATGHLGLDAFLFLPLIDNVILV